MKIFLFFIGILFTYYLPKKVPIVYDLFLFVLLYKASYPYDVLTLFLFCLFLQDLQTMYISKRWILPSIFVGFILLYSYWDISSSLIALVLYALPIRILYGIKRDWMGSADVCFITYFSILLGYQRMSIALLFSTVLGLLFCVLFKKREIPFLCFLSLGVYFSCLYGYKFWFFIFNYILEVM